MSEDASVVDAAWSLCIGLATVYYCFVVDAPLIRKIVIGGLAVIWSFRLTYYLLADRVIGKSEDGRYRALREHWGERANFFHFFFFQAQSLLAIFLSATFLILLDNPTPHITFGEWVAVVLWFIALSGEILADSQLAKFRGNPINKGQTCNVGLWKFSRHPNYFFEWLLWVAYAIAGVSGGANYGFLAVIPAIVMYVFVTRISGIPYTELQAIKSRGDSYKRYQSRTNAFFPWFPKEAS
ncbi:MAG: DUF1295 domain-containing protein [Bdellovibrionales bacterium]|nr:DUF1295 domain-containing protein [Bdellovibrionales bacterium]